MRKRLVELVKKLSSTKITALILSTAIIAAAAIAVFAGEIGSIIAMLLIAVVFAGVILLQVVSSRRTRMQFQRQLRGLLVTIEERAKEVADDGLAESMVAAISTVSARSDESQMKIWELANILHDSGVLQDFTASDLEHRFARSAHDPTRAQNRLPAVQESGGEQYDDRARLMRSLLLGGNDTELYRIGAICDPSLERDLTEFGTVTSVEPNLGIEQLPTDLSYLVIDERSFVGNSWAGVLDAQHTAKFMDLHEMLSVLKQRKVRIMLIERDIASHFSADLRSFADAVFPSTTPLRTQNPIEQTVDEYAKGPLR